MQVWLEDTLNLWLEDPINILNNFRKYSELDIRIFDASGFTMDKVKNAVFFLDQQENYMSLYYQVQVLDLT
jgi:hypothetical protein